MTGIEVSGRDNLIIDNDVSGGLGIRAFGQDNVISSNRFVWGGLDSRGTNQFVYNDVYNGMNIEGGRTGTRGAIDAPLSQLLATMDGTSVMADIMQPYLGKRAIQQDGLRVNKLEQLGVSRMYWHTAMDGLVIEGSELVEPIVISSAALRIYESQAQELQAEQRRNKSARIRQEVFSKEGHRRGDIMGVRGD